MRPYPFTIFLLSITSGVVACGAAKSTASAPREAPSAAAESSIIHCTDGGGRVFPTHDVAITAAGVALTVEIKTTQSNGDTDVLTRTAHFDRPANSPDAPADAVFHDGSLHLTRRESDGSWSYRAVVGGTSLGIVLCQARSIPAAATGPSVERLPLGPDERAATAAAANSFLSRLAAEQNLSPEQAAKLSVGDILPATFLSLSALKSSAADTDLAALLPVWHGSLTALVLLDGAPFGDVWGTRSGDGLFEMRSFSKFDPASASMQKTFRDLRAQDMAATGTAPENYFILDVGALNRSYLVKKSDGRLVAAATQDDLATGIAAGQWLPAEELIGKLRAVLASRPAGGGPG